MNRPRNIGTAAESAVVRVLRAHGFPHAERRAMRGRYDVGDITGTPGICWEIKAGDAARRASDAQVTAWLAETETERVNASAAVGVLVVVRPGVGAVNAGRWWAILPGHTIPLMPATHPIRVHLAGVCQWLTRCGYGTHERSSPE